MGKEEVIKVRKSGSTGRLSMEMTVTNQMPLLSKEGPFRSVSWRHVEIHVSGENQLLVTNH